MHIKLILFFTILIIGVGYGVWDTYAPPFDAHKTIVSPTTNDIKQNEVIPNVMLYDLNGTTHQLHDFKGKVILMNFWATWCPPCIKEFPDLLTLAARYPDTLTIITVSVDAQKAEIDHFLQSLPPQSRTHLNLNNFILIHDPEQNVTRDTFKIYRYPESVLIDPELKIIKKMSGMVDINHEGLNQVIKTLKIQR